MSWNKGRLVDIPGFNCHRDLGLARPTDGRPVELGDQKLDVVKLFVYLGDRISPNGSCKVSTIARIRSTWGTFRQLLSLLTNQAISLKSKGKV